MYGQSPAVPSMYGQSAAPAPSIFDGLSLSQNAPAASIYGQAAAPAQTMYGQSTPASAGLFGGMTLASSTSTAAPLPSRPAGMDMLLDLSGSSGPAKPASSSLLMDDLLSLGGMGAPMAPAAARPAAAAPMLDLLGGFGGGGSMAPGGSAPAMPMMPVMGFGGAPPMLAPETLPPALVAHIGNHPKSHEKAQLLMEDANLRVSYYKVLPLPRCAVRRPSLASAIDRAVLRAREAVGGRMRSEPFRPRSAML